MQRLLVFTILFPPLALVVFDAPDVMARADFRLLNLAALQMAYLIALVPAWILAGVDFWQNRTLTTAITGAVLCYGAALCIGFPFVDPFSCDDGRPSWRSPGCSVFVAVENRPVRVLACSVVGVC